VKTWHFLLGKNTLIGHS